MKRTTMFSTHFPAYHPRKGEPTFFVEKIISGLVKNNIPGYTTETIKSLRDIGVLDILELTAVDPKGHTIRNGRRYSPGDFMVMKIWSGIPYRSTQITLGPPVMITNTWNLDVVGEMFIFDHHVINRSDIILKMASHDGLSAVDFFHWFEPVGKKERWKGQIIAWDQSISY